jgi:hypothetical protein
MKIVARIQKCIQRRRPSSVENLPQQANAAATRQEFAVQRLAVAILLAAAILLLIGISGCTRTDQNDYHAVTDTISDRAADQANSTAQTNSTAAERPSSDGASAPGAANVAATEPVRVRSTDTPPTAPIDSTRTPSKEQPKPARGEPLKNPPSREETSSALRQASPLEVSTASQEMLRLDSSLAGKSPTGSRSGADAVTQALSTSENTPRKIELLIPHKEFVREGREKALRVTFDDIDLLKVLNMEPVPPNVMDYLPEWLKQLDGKRIVLRGWMFPTGRQEGISRFLFVRDNGICCFGRAPKVYDKLGVTMQKGKTTHYIQGRPFDVIGTLSIEADVEGSDVMWLYHLDDALVIEN